MVTALLSSGYRATVESLSGVHSSSASTSLNANCTCRVGKVQSIFISGSLKLFRYSAILYSAFYSVPIF